MRIDIDMVDAMRIERAGPADQAMNFIPFREQKFGEVGAVLPGDTGDNGALAHTATSSY